MEARLVNRIRAGVLWGCALAGVAYIGLFAGKMRDAGAANENLPDEDIVVFDEGLTSGWQDWSWAERKIPDADVKFGAKPTIRMVPGGWKGLFLHHSAISVKGYKALSFFIHGGTTGRQKLSVCAVDANNKFGAKVDVTAGLGSRVIPAGKFEVCVIPLEKLLSPDARLSGLCFQDASGTTQAPLYLANIRLTAGRKRVVPSSIDLAVNATQEIGPISPYIYALAFPGKEHIEELRLKLWRWGGNPNTRYNWEKGDCWNAARDWEFRNYGKSDSPAGRLPSGVADQGYAAKKAQGADFLLTIPTIGWVARDNNNATRSLGVPNQSGPPVAPGSEAIANYDPTENRQRVSVRSLPRKGKPFSDPPDLNDNVVYQDEWVAHLVKKFGKANAGGVKFYAMDNEPDLWDSTHTDMHPVRPDYDELLKQFLDYGTAVKDVDPTAQITGPVSWGWTGYFFSPRDRGSDNYKTHADRMAHGDIPFLPWFLEQVAAHDKKAGRRTLDILDVHYYPQGDGVYGGKSDPPTNALRLRSTRALWDPNYSDESWIGTAVQLIPRLRQWVAKYYPGTKIGLTEWNWGADKTLNGGLAVAEVLGILGREQVYMACYWTAPPPDSPGFYAYKMFRNADGAGHGFGDVAVAASSSEPNDVSCFGSIDSQTGETVIMLLNKRPQDDMTVNLALKTKKPVSAAQVYRYSGEDLKTIAHLPDIALNGGHVRVKLPAYSITLLRCR